MNIGIKWFAAALLLAAQSMAVAQYGWAVQVIGEASDAVSGQDFKTCNEYTGSGQQSVSCGASVGGVAGLGSASVQTRTGHLGFAATSSIESISFSGGGNIRSNGYVAFSDMVRIDNPNLSGTGTLTYRLYLDRTALLRVELVAVPHQVDSVASVDAVIFINEIRRVAQSDGRQLRQTVAGVEDSTSSSGQVDNGAGWEDVPSALGYHTFSVPFVFNQDFVLSLTLNGDAYAQVSGQGEASSDLNAMNSLDWAGIQQVDVGGVPVDYTLWSQSGIDWNRSYAPVPEPGSAWLLLAALPVIGWHVRRQRRDAKPA